MTLELITVGGLLAASTGGGKDGEDMVTGENPNSKGSQHANVVDEDNNENRFPKNHHPWQVHSHSVSWVMTSMTR